MPVRTRCASSRSTFRSPPVRDQLGSTTLLYTFAMARTKSEQRSWSCTMDYRSDSGMPSWMHGTPSMSDCYCSETVP